MLHRSIIEARSQVAFPEHTGERIYMEPFTKADGLPSHLARWQDTVNAMLDGIDTDGPIYLMIDQSAVRSGNAQRRPGLHIDGYWNPGSLRHGSHMAAAHRGDQPMHRSVPARHSPFNRHKPDPKTGMHQSHRPGLQGNDWANATFDAPEAIILASSISAACGYVGNYEGQIGDMGDCAHIDTSNMDVLPMIAGTVYAGNVNCLHESLPVQMDCERTLVRLNVPGWTPEG